MAIDKRIGYKKENKAIDVRNTVASLEFYNDNSINTLELPTKASNGLQVYQKSIEQDNNTATEEYINGKFDYPNSNGDISEYTMGNIDSPLEYQKTGESSNNSKSITKNIEFSTGTFSNTDEELLKYSGRYRFGITKCPKRLWLVYASQTGKSEMISYEIREELWKVGVLTYPTSIDKFEDIFYSYFENNSSDELFPPTIFVVSTTGQGEVPNSMRSFWQRLLYSDISRNKFKTFQFVIFGLGDRCFGNKFNLTARKLHHRLIQMGASELNPWGLGDESHDFGLLGEFDPWLENLAKFLYQEKCRPNIDLPIRYLCEIVGESEYLETEKCLNEQKTFLNNYYKNISKLVICTTIKNSNFCISNRKKVVKNITLSTIDEEDNFTYLTGSHAVIWPTSPPNTVKRLVELLGQNLTCKTLIIIRENPEYFLCPCRDPDCKIISNKYMKCFSDSSLSNLPLNCKMSLFTLFSRYLDIVGIPGRRFLWQCYNFAKDKLHKDRLFDMVQRTLDSKKDYSDYIRDEHRNYVEVLWDFNSVELPLNNFVSLLHLINPRYYSICNTPLWYRKDLWQYINILYHIENDPLISSLITLRSSNISVFIPKKKILYKDLSYVETLKVFFLSKVLNSKHTTNTIISSPISIYYKIMNKLAQICINYNTYGRLLASLTLKPLTTQFIDLCIGIIEWKTAHNREITGLCSSFLNNLIPHETKLLVGIENQLLPIVSPMFIDLKIPLILIAPGIGISGIISIIQQRVLFIFINLQFNKLKGKDMEIAPCIVYLGFRYSDEDFPFINYIFEWCRNPYLNRWIVINIAYSRSSPTIENSIFHNLPNIGYIECGCYLQSLILKTDVKLLCKCINDGIVIVCGNAVIMPNEIRNTLSDCLVRNGDFDTLDEALVHLRKFITKGRYIEETWN
ncbi:flavodoxin family protein [Cryptosporidium muris RN66]|uniref:Flavodoxin family protein n=1 Tax=Cryptosporidium muris (strain RN66) TaxID=441375 RepID=B6AHS8_CRYMR|nr:flavodoxin family protein [Cryptosporidium muris RN66]EEA07769.1 flavodoxin family protein [Cryptosporidium muris RN66]|eukprot:XP_002142118.1 flavodoxin family protein [Cryptosporidium muris RN66]